MRYVLLLLVCCAPAHAQISKAQHRELRDELAIQQAAFDKVAAKLRGEQRSDIAVCLKAVRWALKHTEFPKKDYVRQAQRVLRLVQERLALANSGAPIDVSKTSVRGFVSKLDGSVQPYAISFPSGFDPKSTKSLPLHLKLHGRANQMNEVNFFHRHEGKAPGKDQRWIQLDIYGRGNNAYRWAGEVDVFEALAEVTRRHYIDVNRITVHGFSMGGAGAYHLGVHHPGLWSSAGAGAGFVDFYKYQRKTEQLPPYQHATLGIYDAVDYAMNTFNVPFVAYGGENDKQLLSGQMMKAAAAKVGIDLKLIVGPNMGHKFDPKSFAEFMGFHAQATEQGRPKFGDRKHIRFTTRTLKYNTCDWLTIEEMTEPYVDTTVDAKLDDEGTLKASTKNVRSIRFARGLATDVVIDGTRLPLESAAGGLLPDVYYTNTDGKWSVLDYQDSKAFPNNPEGHKRHDLQGPIDDAFMHAFVCVRGTGEPWSRDLDDWANWTLKRFGDEWHKWHRGDLPTVSDTDLTDDMIASKNLILFGDPGSNRLISQVVKDLPLTWTKDEITFAGETYSTASHAVAMVFPNPLNPRRYVVLNSGHTFHEDAFKASNSWLFPRQGDAAVMQFKPGKEVDSLSESITAGYIFDQQWKLPE